MTRRRRLLLILAGSLAGVLALLVVTTLIVVQTAWFSDFVRQKIIAAVEDSTGGQVEIGSFQFDPWALTVRIRNFVLHGTEANTAAPLAQVALLEIHLKLLSGIAHTVDLAYIGLQQPRINLIANPDGTTNIPAPKVQKPSSNSSGLQTVVDLKIGEFQIQNGAIDYLQQTTSFAGHGQNLAARLNYNSLHPSYSGQLTIHPLILAQAARPSLPVDVDVPLTIEGDAIRVANATLATAHSKIALDGSLQHLSAPLVDARASAALSLPELQRSFDLPLNTQAKGVPQQLSAELAAHLDQKSNVVQVQRAHVQIGDSTLDANGSMHDAGQTGEAAQFHGNLALGQLATLFDVSSPQVNGVLTLDGRAALDAQNNYRVDGTARTEGLSLRTDSSSIRNVSLKTPFHADPYLISLDGLTLSALGGSVSAKVFVEKLRNLSVEGTLHNFSLPVLAGVLTGKHLGYDGSLNGSVNARGDLKAKGSAGVQARASIAISPGHNGVPVSGRIDAEYNGATSSLALGQSYVTLPHSRIQLAGAINRRLDLNLRSTNLNDFLPAMNFGAQKPSATMPIHLTPGGTATIDASVTGQMSNPEVTGHVAVRHFAMQGGPEDRGFDALTLDLAASSSHAAAQNGQMTSTALQASFDAAVGLRKWSPVASSPIYANLTIRRGDVADLASLAGQTSVPATGALTADVHINGTFGNPLGAANVQVSHGSIDNEPFTRLAAQLNLTDRTIALAPLELVSDAGTIDVNATFQHPRESFTVGDLQLHVRTTPLQLVRLQQVQQKSAGMAGTVQMTADASARLGESKGKSTLDLSNITADVTARGLRLNHQDAGDLTLTARTNNRTVQYNLASNFAGSSIAASGQTTLSQEYATTADLTIQSLSVQKALSIAGQSTIPATGTLSATGHVNGTLTAPQANLTFDLAKAQVYGEIVDGFNGQMRYSNQLIDIPNLQLDTPAGSVTLSASYRHTPNDLQNGTVQAVVKSTPIALARVSHLHTSEPTLAGTAQLTADLNADVRQENGSRTVRVHTLNATAGTEGLRLNGRDLGGVRFSTKTSGTNLDFLLDSDLAQSKVHASGRSQLSGDYVTDASLTFANIRYTNIAPFISEEPTVRPAFDALVEGNASVHGPIMTPEALNAQLELSRLEANTVPIGSPTGSSNGRKVGIVNQGPIRVSLDHSVVNVQQFHLSGPGSTVDIAGTVNLKNADAAMNIKLNAGLDLGVLQDVDREIYSSGKLNMDAAVHGTLHQPLVNGRIELKNANINYAEAPNGLSNANGVILLTGTGANIQSLTGQSGGGDIKVTGFAGFSGSAITYNVKAAAKAVRVRYSGISVTSDSTITLTGNTNRSLVAGNVTINRIAYNSSSDAGSLLSSFASTPPSTPTAPSAFLAATHLNVHILTAPDVRVVTTYADRLSVEANLSVRGTAVTPGILGRVVITDGQLVFFGNTYTVNTGTINFYNPTSVQPVVNISLETLAQGVDVTLGVAGPMNNLQLSYTSDPPLSFEQIVELLATNTTPNDPNIVANQPATPQQSFTQMGESAILGQAVANPLASRVQRVFGLSQFKIDPSFSGSNGQPSARVTLQQKIASNITFTYITDVTQTNSEIVRVQWDLTPKFSAVGLRDFNGNVSVEFFYKFKVR